MITQLEPQIINRFLIEFPEEFNIKSWHVLRVNKPKFTDGKWENIKFIFNEPIGSSASIGLISIINYLNINKNKNLKFEIKLQSLDPVGLVIEEWIIKVKNVLTIDFGELDYEDNGFQYPNLVVEPLDCILKNE